MARRLSPVLIALLVQGSVQAQVAVEARLLDAEDRSPLAFAAVFDPATDRSVITNADGLFRITVQQPTDSLRFSYLGYHTRRIAVADIPAHSDILLARSTNALAEVSVEGPNDALYRLIIQAAKRMEAAPKQVAKTYYALSTHAGDKPLEAIECYYNGTLKGAGIERLDLKNGRIAVAPDNGRYVMNLNTSRGFLLLRPTTHKSAFPDTPLQHRSIRALRAQFDITLVGILDAGKGSYHIRFEPRKNDGQAFAGELWIDPAQAEVQRLVLRCAPCAKHPFLSMVPESRLTDVAIHYALQRTQHSSGWTTDQVELDYTLNFVDSPTAGRLALAGGAEEKRSIHSQGLLHCYDHGQPFNLPLFRYEEDAMDYRKVLTLPFDSLFWADASLLVPTEQQRADMDFFTEHGMLAGHVALTDQARSGIFESNMAQWSPERRISLKKFGATDATNTAQRHAVANVDRIRLEVQLFLDINAGDGPPRCFSATVLDGYRSFHHLPMHPWTDAFLNIHFDLCEIERRRMQAELDSAGTTVEAIRRIHLQAERNVQRITDEYLRDTRYGEDQRGIAAWNERVLRRIGIDNLRMFGLGE